MTARQLQYLRLIADGGSQKAAAREMGVSVERVKDIAATVRHKLRADTAAQAAVTAFKMGLL